MRILNLDLLQEEVLGECITEAKDGEEADGGDSHLWRSTKREFNMSDAR